MKNGDLSELRSARRRKPFVWAGGSSWKAQQLSSLSVWWEKGQARSTQTQQRWGERGNHCPQGRERAPRGVFFRRRPLTALSGESLFEDSTVEALRQMPRSSSDFARNLPFQVTPAALGAAPDRHNVVSSTIFASTRRAALSSPHYAQCCAVNILRRLCTDEMSITHH